MKRRNKNEGNESVCAMRAFTHTMHAWKKEKKKKRNFYSVCKSGTVTLGLVARGKMICWCVHFYFSFSLFFFSFLRLFDWVNLPAKMPRMKVLILRIYPFRISCCERNQVLYFRVFDISCTKTKNGEEKNRTKSKKKNSRKQRNFSNDLLFLPTDFNAAHCM